MITKMPPPPGNPVQPLPSGDVSAALATAWREHAPDIIATALLLARRGDVPALRLILERVAPAKGRLLTLDLPKVQSVADVPILQKRLVELVASGSMTIEEAAGMSGILQNYISSVEVVEHETRLAAIEQSLEENRGARN
ncbi:MAG TPA: hypothetical protein VH206_14290 [Xanthobacteraceae bacterium]|nr:hypothetical protein [Xanthobacteraceae bacterium]